VGFPQALIFVDFGEYAQPGGGVIAAVPRIFMQAKGLNGAGKRKEDNGGGEEGPEVEMNLPNGLRHRCCCNDPDGMQGWSGRRSIRR